MGYEVLEGDGGQVDLPRDVVPPTDVYDLSHPASSTASDEPSDEPPAQPPDRPPDQPPHQPPDEPPDQPGQTDHASEPGSAGPRAPLVLLLCASLLVGGVAGGLWASRHAGLSRAAEQAGQVSVVAMITSVDAVRAQRVADFTVKVVNAGPRPLELVTSAPDERVTQGHQVVQALGGATTVPAGGSLSADVRVGVDCSSATDPRSLIRVPLRASDGTVHQVPVAAQDVLNSDFPDESPCSSPDDPVLDARLTGSVNHPRLTLTNLADYDVNVILDVEHSPFVAQSARFSVLRLTPPLPQVLGPKQVLTLAVALSPWSCPRSLSEVVNSELSPYVVLRAGPPGAPPLLQEPVGLDLSTVWGAALARECS